jgi:hypothetical protein
MLEGVRPGQTKIVGLSFCVLPAKIERRKSVNV